MPSLDDIARFQTSLSPDDVAWLHALVTDWQIIADLSFSDLVLWVPDAEAKGMWAGAQIRPTTGPTTLLRGRGRNVHAVGADRRARGRAQHR